MDFSKVIPLIISEFEKEHVRYAVIGGFALGILGIMRATMDIDFLIHAEDLPKVDKIMDKYQYRCVHRSRNVSQFVADIKIFGEIDIIHAFREVSLKMLSKSSVKKVLGGRHKIKVLRPEDIIGLKIQALVNDPQREAREYADIEAVISHFKNQLDWDIIKEYFGLFRLNDRYAEIRKKHDLPA